MLTEGYLAKLKKYRMEDPNEIQIVITRVTKHPLSPSWKLLNDCKKKRISWEEFDRRLREEICGNPDAIREMDRIAKLSDSINVRLICYEKTFPCHRFIVKEMIERYIDGIRCK